MGFFAKLNGFLNLLSFDCRWIGADWIDGLICQSNHFPACNTISTVSYNRIWSKSKFGDCAYIAGGDANTNLFPLDPAELTMPAASMDSMILEDLL